MDSEPLKQRGIKMIVEVTKETYRIVETGNSEKTLAEFENYSTDIYYKAFELCGLLKDSVTIERVTHWKTMIEGCKDVFLPFIGEKSGKYYVGQKITGMVSIGPKHFASDALSRYNPVNGWEIPETIEL
jgi:hypothetical protein